MSTAPSPELVQRAVEQTATLVEQASPDRYGDATPCADWDVERLLRHIVAGPRNFIAMSKGEDVDWDNPPALGDSPAEDFRAGAGEYLAFLRESDGSAGPALPEFAVHAWDLSTALGSKDALDDDVAEAALDFVRPNLTEERRGTAFGPERPAPADASASDRLAAFAGRTV